MFDFLNNNTTKLVLESVILLIIGFVTTRYIRRFANKVFKLEEYQPNYLTNAEQMKLTVVNHTISVIQYIIWAIVLVSIAALLEMTVFLRVFTTVGVFVGYVAKEFVTDFISGFLIISEQQFRVGDTITVNAVTGVVQIIGLRTTTILTADEERFILSNRLLTSVLVHPSPIFETHEIAQLKQQAIKNKKRRRRK